MIARELDVIILAVEPGIVYYGFPVGPGKVYSWEIPADSTFDTSTLQPEKRYHVLTKVIQTITGYDKYKRKMVKSERYDWVQATELKPKAKVKALTAKESAFKKQADALPWADNGDLFKGL